MTEQENPFIDNPADPDLLSDENLDAIADAHSSVPPELAEADSGDEDLEQDNEQEGEEDEPDDDADTDDDSDASDEEIDEEDIDLEGVDVSKYKTKEAAIKSARAAELRMQKAILKEKELQKEIEELRAFQFEDAYDTSVFQQQSQTDVQSAFQYALENGALADAQSIIAKVNADAQESAAFAAATRASGDEAEYVQAAELTQKINAIAEDMREKVYLAKQQQATQPLIERQQKNDLEAAWKSVNDETGNIAAKHHSEIQQLLTEMPYLLTDSSGALTQASATEGYRKAVKLVADTTNNIDDIVAEKVKEELNKANLAARKKNAGSAGGETGAGKSASDKGEKLSEADEFKANTFKDAKNKSIGMNKFMSM